MIRRTAIIAALAAGFACAQNTTTVILVRHAERASAAMSDTDLGLSPAGVKRARQLERVLSDAHIQAIYTSTLPRTIQTAQPLAKHLGITPAEITDVAALVGEIRSHPGRTSLVVHHSNTLPKIMEGLGIRSVPAIGETQYDWLFIVTIRDPRDVTLLSLHYGE
jgi:phosphohistidine phosphatase SixA